MTTMKDVAREAGVSLGTVSNVLNNNPSVLPQNRKRVLAAVDRLGFRSNMVARTLKTKTSKNIGLIIQSIDNPFYPELARGVEDAANEAGLTVFLCNVDRDVQKERKYIDALITKNVDGIILVKPQISMSEVDDICKKSQIILVDIDGSLKSEYNVVNANDSIGVLEAMNLLYEYGHKQIAFISGNTVGSESSKNRYKTYIKFLEDKGIPVAKDYIVRGNYDWKSGYMGANKLLNLSIPPTAIFAENDLMAIGAMKAIQEKGLSIPKDISVIGFDNIDTTNLCTPALTTVHYPKYEIGTVSVEMLNRCIEKSETGINVVGQKITLETKLVTRNSVGPVNDNTRN